MVCFLGGILNISEAFKHEYSGNGLHGDYDEDVLK